MFDLMYVVHLIAYLTIGMMFILLINLKYSMKTTLISYAFFFVFSYAIYILISIYNIMPTSLPPAIFVLPLAIYAIIVSQSKGSRFIFTFFTAITFGVIASLYTRLISLAFGDNPIMLIAISTIFYTAIIYIILRYRRRYLIIQDQIIAGWPMLAFFSVLAYSTITFMTNYPTYIVYRPNAIPSLLIATLFIHFTYFIMYKLIVKDVQIYNKKQDVALLEMENKYQKSQLEIQDIYYKFAYEDALTGLKNRRAFEEIKEKNLTKKTLCISLDINNLKQINDNHGHHEGDKALIAITGVIKKTFSNHEKIYRIGGDEFVVILDNKDGSHAEGYAEQIKLSLKNLSASLAYDISVAAGWCCSIKDKTKTIDEMVGIADQRMYKYKRSSKTIQHA